MRKMLRLSSLAVLCVLVLGTVLAACSQAPAPTSAPPAPPSTSAPAAKTSAPAPTTSAAVPAKVYTLKAAHWNPPQGAMPTGVEWYLKEVEKRSNGQIKFERYWAEALAPAAQQLDALRTGIADVASIYSAYYPGKIPLGTIGSIAWYYADDVWTVNSAFRELYETIPALTNELAQYKTKYISQMSGAQSFIFTVPPVKKLTDLKGVKIYARGEQAVIVKELGVAPVSMTAPEVYTAVQTKTIDGAIWSFSGISQYAIEELIKSSYMLGLGTGSMVIGINQDAWAKLPADLQKILVDTGKDHLKAYHEIYQGSEETGQVKFKEKGIVFTTPTAEERATVDKIIKDKLVTKWIADHPNGGQEVYDTMVKLIAKYKALYPYKK